MQLESSMSAPAGAASESAGDPVQIEIPDMGEPPKGLPAELALAELGVEGAPKGVVEEKPADAPASTAEQFSPTQDGEKKPGDAAINFIPDRVYFRIGDVAEITAIKPYVLRFWEKEFEIIGPVKNSAGQRVYRRSDVEAVLLIKRLLYTERFSIEGAKKRIRELRRQRELGNEKRKRGELNDEKLRALRDLRQGLVEIRELCRSAINLA